MEEADSQPRPGEARHLLKVPPPPGRPAHAGLSRAARLRRPHSDRSSVSYFRSARRRRLDFSRKHVILCQTGRRAGPPRGALLRGGGGAEGHGRGGHLQGVGGRPGHQHAQGCV